jgi:hypothetical protein
MGKHIVLEFGSVTLVEPGIVEASIDTGVELDAQHMMRGYEACARLAGQPFGLLINRGTDYSMTVSALENIGNHPDMRAIAVYVHGDARPQVAHYHKEVYGERVPIEIFTSRDEALSWLRDVLRAGH